MYYTTLKTKTMKKNLLLTFSLFLLAFTANSQEIDVKKMNDLISHIENNNKSIGAITVAKNGKTLYSRSFGQKNLKNNTKPTKDLKYQIGSVTKMLTATMIYQLAEKNKLDLNEKIDTYFPTVPNASKISINNLLEHTSGLGDFVTKNDSLPFWLTKPATEKEIFSEIQRQGTLFQPGDSIEYSNTGYYLLTRILEKKYNKNYKTIINENIIKPLGLKNTRSLDTKDQLADVAKSYSFKTEWTEVEEFYFPNVIGVGDVVTTTEDLTTIVNAIITHKLINAESLAKMKPKAEQTFGKGLMQFPFYDKTFYGHGGDTFGTHSLVGYNENDGYSISLIINGLVFSRNDFTIGILSILYGKEYKFPDFTKYAVTPEALTSYEGTYSTKDFPLKVKIYKDGDDLMAQATGQSSFALEPYAENKFRFKTAQIEIEFKIADNKMLFSQAGNEVIFSRE